MCRLEVIDLGRALGTIPRPRGLIEESCTRPLAGGDVARPVAVPLVRIVWRPLHLQLPLIQLFGRGSHHAEKTCVDILELGFTVDPTMLAFRDDQHLLQSLSHEDLVLIVG